MLVLNTENVLDGDNGSGTADSSGAVNHDGRLGATDSREQLETCQLARRHSTIRPVGPVQVAHLHRLPVSGHSEQCDLDLCVTLHWLRTRQVLHHDRDPTILLRTKLLLLSRILRPVLRTLVLSRLDRFAEHDDLLDLLLDDHPPELLASVIQRSLGADEAVISHGSGHKVSVYVHGRARGSQRDSVEILTRNVLVSEMSD